MVEHHKHPMVLRSHTLISKPKIIKLIKSFKLTKTLENDLILSINSMNNPNHQDVSNLIHKIDSYNGNIALSPKMKELKKTLYLWRLSAKGKFARGMDAITNRIKKSGKGKQI